MALIGLSMVLHAHMSLARTYKMQMHEALNFEGIVSAPRVPRVILQHHFASPYSPQMQTTNCHTSVALVPAVCNPYYLYRSLGAAQLLIAMLHFHASQRQNGAWECIVGMHSGRLNIAQVFCGHMDCVTSICLNKFVRAEKIPRFDNLRVLHMA